jgi:hypothetical protein
VANLLINGGAHNVIFAASSRDTVYAFDADASPCVTYWSRQLIASGETWLDYTDVGNNDIKPDIGIVGTPVIDPGGGILYAVARTKLQGTACTPSADCHQRLHALNILDGSEMAGGPVEITASVAGKGDGASGSRVPLETLMQNQRAGLALVGSSVYVCWGSHNDRRPYHGWVLQFNKSNLRASPLAFSTTPDGFGGGIWMAGGAPAVDSNNNLYVITGNGVSDGKRNFSDSFLKLSTGLSLDDWFTPIDHQIMDDSNLDLGAGGAVVLVDLPSSSTPHLVVGGGKAGAGNAGEIYVLDRDALGHLEGNGPPIVQKFPLGQKIFATPAFWQDTLYLAGYSGPLTAFALDPAKGRFNPIPTSSSTKSFGFPGATPSISSNGSSNGIVWLLDNSKFGTGPAILYAYDAMNLRQELWDSSQVGSRDQAGNAVKFTVPTIANGKVYVGTSTEIDVYGLLP